MLQFLLSSDILKSNKGETSVNSLTIRQKIRDISATAAVAATSIVANPLAAFAQTNCETAEGGISGGVECVGGSQDNASLFGEGSIFNAVTKTLLFLVGVISVIMLIIGGIRYIVSGGDQNAVTGAKNTILYAIIGIVVAFLAFAAVEFVTNSLNPQ
jgi:hypothetical protein